MSNLMSNLIQILLSSWVLYIIFYVFFFFFLKLCSKSRIVSTVVALILFSGWKFESRGEDWKSEPLDENLKAESRMSVGIVDTIQLLNL